MTNVKLDFTSSISYTHSKHTLKPPQMLSHGSHDDCNNNLNINHLNNNINLIISTNFSSTSTTLSSSSSSSNHSPFTHTTKTMEEVWKDINLSATTNHRDAVVKGYRGFILQDFLAKPFSSNDVTPPTTTAVCVSSPTYGSPSPPPQQQPPMLLNLNSGPDQLNFLTEDPTRNVCPLDVPFDQVLASANSSSGYGIGGMRMLPATDRTGGDRRHKRMIKNRESAARSRARKQAYTNELENEVERLKEENAMLKRQQQQLQVATAAQMTKKGGLQRTSTAPF